ncbi:hypothetical protein [Chryseobacterium sp. Leaf394]|uniref:tetratricopeptide repeat protein n=1 Tax=Chryseobacterium sp. Leaf394 TaxID=1736361 RepID=UPI0006F55AD8|nr:hypothetical protein [Chryseobacterium sp. Leaf394]KQS92063.1 hypothetical protein ASG21_06305 [Chryseobacterium sp. Leaf394]
MEELSDELFNSIMIDLEKGDQFEERKEHNLAIVNYQNGIEKLVPPKTDWEIALHLYTALADAYFNLKDYIKASYNYNQALQCPEGTANGYVWLGYGQSLFELGMTDKAKDALMSSYMLEGNEIFDDIDKKYFELIKSSI